MKLKLVHKRTLESIEIGLFLVLFSLYKQLSIFHISFLLHRISDVVPFPVSLTRDGVRCTHPRDATKSLRTGRISRVLETWV